MIVCYYRGGTILSWSKEKCNVCVCLQWADWQRTVPKYFFLSVSLCPPCRISIYYICQQPSLFLSLIHCLYLFILTFLNFHHQRPWTGSLHDRKSISEHMGYKECFPCVYLLHAIFTFFSPSVSDVYLRIGQYILTSFFYLFDFFFLFSHIFTFMFLLLPASW